MALGEFIEAAIPDPCTVLAVPLRPFSLGHFLLMRRLGCPYADDVRKQIVNLEDVQSAVSDLLYAISICAHTYEEFEEFLCDPVAYEKWLQAWKPYIEEMQNDPTFNMFEKFEAFQRYLEKAMKVPEFFPLQEDGPDSTGAGMHWSQSVLQVLVSMGYEETKVLNMPIGKAFYLYLQELAKNGAIQFVRDDLLQAAE